MTTPQPNPSPAPSSIPKRGNGQPPNHLSDAGLAAWQTRWQNPKYILAFQQTVEAALTQGIQTTIPRFAGREGSHAPVLIDAAGTGVAICIANDTRAPQMEPVELDSKADAVLERRLRGFAADVTKPAFRHGGLRFSARCVGFWEREYPEFDLRRRVGNRG